MKSCHISGKWVPLPERAFCLFTACLSGLDVVSVLSLILPALLPSALADEDDEALSKLTYFASMTGWRESLHALPSLEIPSLVPSLHPTCTIGTTARQASSCPRLTPTCAHVRPTHPYDLSFHMCSTWHSSQAFCVEAPQCYAKTQDSRNLDHLGSKGRMAVEREANIWPKSPTTITSTVSHEETKSP